METAMRELSLNLLQVRERIEERLEQWRAGSKPAWLLYIVYEDMNMCSMFLGVNYVTKLDLLTRHATCIPQSVSNAFLSRGTHTWRAVAVGQDVQKISRRHKVESWKSQALGLQVFGQSFLALGKLTLQVVQLLVQVGYVGGLHHILRLRHTLHNLLRSQAMSSCFLSLYTSLYLTSFYSSKHRRRMTAPQWVLLLFFRAAAYHRDER